MKYDTDVYLMQMEIFIFLFKEFVVFHVLELSHWK